MRPKPLPGGIRQPAPGRQPGALSPLELPPLLLTPHFQVHNVQAWRVQALPVIYFWVSFGVIFKSFLANFPNCQNLENSFPAAARVLPSKVQDLKKLQLFASIFASIF